MEEKIVLVAGPFQGHLNPLLHLANLLYSKGFSITIAHSTLISPTNSNFTFLPIPDGLNPVDAYSMLFTDLINEINVRSEAPLREKIGDEMRKRDDRIRCVIYDPVMYIMDGVASDLGIPSLVLETISAAILVTNTAYPRFNEQGLIPLQESMSEDLTEFHPFRYKDLPIYKFHYHEAYLEMVANMNSRIKNSRAYILNTLDCLEHRFLSNLKQLKHPVQVFPVGPLHKMSEECYPSSASFWKEDSNCISWLNKHAPSSVIYVSTGSVSEIDDKELVETAWGLVNSEQPFLWVIRPGSTKDQGGNWMSRLSEVSNFEQVVVQRGCVVEWAPQKEVLMHEAVGGFWSHCGWNSTMESVSLGVPMICWPRVGDQRMHARCVSHVWRVGFELEAMERGEIERMVRKLMVGKEGEAMRGRAFDLKMEIEAATNKGGSSVTSLNNLVKFILSL